MSKRKAPKGCFWRGNTLWGRIQAEGKDRKFTLRTDDVNLAKRRLREEREKHVAITRYGDQRHSFNDAIEKWLPFIEREISRKTLKRYKTSLRILLPKLDGFYLDEIDKKLIGELVEWRRQPAVPVGKKQAIRVTNATIKRDLTALSSVMDFAVDHDWIETNPVMTWLRPQMRKKTRLRERRDPIVLPSHEDVQRVIARAPNLLATMIEAAWRTGARLDELVSAKRTQVHHGRRQLTVIGKRNKQRVIDLDGWGYEEVFKPIPATLASPWLFWHHDGRPYSTASGRFRAIVASVAKQAQKQEQAFRPFRFHDLRHLHAVDWLKSGRSIYDLQKRLGHTSLLTTEMYLEYLTPEEAEIVKRPATNSGS